MELPYRLPAAKGLALHMWRRAWLFVRKAGTIIVVISVLMWVLTSHPKPPAQQLHGLARAEQARVALWSSAADHVGRALEPLMRPRASTDRRAPR